MTVLHATEAATVHLAVAARSAASSVDVDRALYDDRTLVKQLAMRRTLFAFPRDLLPATWGSASARVAAQQQSKIARDVVRAGLAKDGQAWLEQAGESVLALLAEVVGGLASTAIRGRLPQIGGTVAVGSPTSKWGGEVPIAPRVLTWLGAKGLVVRGVSTGHWRVSRPEWTVTEQWLDEVPDRLVEAEGYAVLVRRWLYTFGPGTALDLQWWLGSTANTVRRRLADVGAVEVSLDGGGVGWVLGDDVDAVAPVEDWAALLPVLDPTTMGWKERDFYLATADTRQLFDTNGNAGSTAWWSGRIVGCWVQDDDGIVSVVAQDLPPGARAALELEGERLTEWIDGVRIASIYASPQMKSSRLP